MSAHLHVDAPADALRALTEEFDRLVGEFAGDTTTELQQAQDLIRDAVAEISHSFQAIGAAGNGAAPLAEHVGKVLRALQFEDMVRQVLEHVVQRLDQLSRLTTGLIDEAAKPDDGDCAARLLGLSDRLAADRQRLHADRHRAVTQSNMDAGDVEFF